MYKKTAVTRARASASKRVRQRAGSKAPAKKPVARKAAIAKPQLTVAAKAPELSEKQRRHLRGLAHPLKPLILLGNAGLTEGVTKETERVLHDHELVKVKAPGGDRDVRDAMFADLALKTHSALVHRIGNIAVLYRPRPDLARILLPDA